MQNIMQNIIHREKKTYSQCEKKMKWKLSLKQKKIMLLFIF